MEDLHKSGRKRKRQVKNRQRKRPYSTLRSNNDLKPHMEIVPCSGQLLRVIHPYPYTFCSFAKGRWVGQTLLEVYCKEFGAYPKSYYEKAIEQGRIMVSDKKVPATYRIRGEDVLMHTVHRHEPAVAVASEQRPFVKIVGETDSLVAVDKPATLPVHPCGGYHLNSLVKILEENFPKLFAFHRLDRLTSGLVILAKSDKVATTWGKALQQRDCQKIYLARVKGRFGQNIVDIPRLEGTLPVDGEYTQIEQIKASEEKEKADVYRRRNAHGYWFTDAKGEISDTTIKGYGRTEFTIEQLLSSLDDKKPSSINWLNVSCPVRVKDHKNGVCESGSFEDIDDATYLKTVKPAQTAFAIVKYNDQDDSTLLLVRPCTGRTHQIRIHLQYLGHSIVNDPNYGGDMWFGNPVGKEQCSKAQEILDATSSGLNSNDVPATEEELNNIVYVRDDKKQALDSFNTRTCVWCARNDGKPVTERSKLEFLVRSPGLWLHALQYKVNDISFCTEIPKWGTY